MPPTTMVMALPIAVYDMVLAGRLIIKGFDQPSDGLPSM
jgi:hypothetical protein